MAAVAKSDEDDVAEEKDAGGWEHRAAQKEKSDASS